MKYQSPQDFAYCDLQQLSRNIHSCGYHNQKAKSIQGASLKIVEEHGSMVPDNMNDLTELPGVGRKTANVVLGNIYNVPSVKKKIKKKLLFSSKISHISKSKSFIEFEKNKWIKISDIKPISYKTNSIFEKIKIFNGTKYKWGGKSYQGIDCSALVQLCFTFNNQYFPRDSEDQFKYLKKKIQRKNVKKNDLFFWKGHIAIALSGSKLIHAYGPSKKVLVMNINYAINRIKKTTNLKVIGIRRIN